MAKNQVQFQKGISIPAFLKQYGQEKQCQSALHKLRWPEGFKCPAWVRASRTLQNLTRIIPMQSMSSPNLLDERDDFWTYKATTHHLVSGHLHTHTKHMWGIGVEPETTTSNWL